MFGRTWKDLVIWYYDYDLVPIFYEKFMHASKISRLKQFCSLKEKLFFGTPWSYYDNELENFKIAFFGNESISILWSANLYTYTERFNDSFSESLNFLTKEEILNSVKSAFEAKLGGRRRRKELLDIAS